MLEREFAAGNRVVAIATRPATGLTAVTPDDEHDLHLAGYLTFLDQPKPSAAGVDRPPRRARHHRQDRHRRQPRRRRDRLPDPRHALRRDAHRRRPRRPRRRRTHRRRHRHHRSSPGSARSRRPASCAPNAAPGRRSRSSATASTTPSRLHHADVGISVDSATDVAKDAADIILLERDLDVLADGVAEGRRIFANTIKYVLMGTSSNFGNMFSVTVAAAFLPFLPMLPSQILLNNLLYDSSQMTIPTDHVDDEQLARPSHWDIGFIRRFMIRFGPISSVFDFATFAVMLWGFHAAAPLFRSGWFVESLATQTLIVFVIRTRRVPFLRSRPSRPLLVSVIAVVAGRRADPAEPAERHRSASRPCRSRSSPCWSPSSSPTCCASRSPSTSSSGSTPRPPTQPLRRGHAPPDPPRRRPLEPPRTVAGVRPGGARHVARAVRRGLGGGRRRPT